MAVEKGVSAAQIALAWLLQQPVVTSVIVGANKTEQLADNLAAANVRFTAGELAALDEVSRLAPEYPGWMIERQNPRLKE
jgi:aryl-alcohol dehydrogenase-like predicted oxidoreductase